MVAARAIDQQHRRVAAGAIRIPLPVWMMLASLALGVSHGFDGKQLVSVINTGFGGALGEYALILLPSFIIAHLVSHSASPSLKGWGAPLLAPLAGAAMICPDTAYAALGPMTSTRKLSTLFGAYAGFKLLFPAGPLIVATGLGAFDRRLPWLTIPVFGAAWIAGLLYARAFERWETTHSSETGRGIPLQIGLPLLVLSTLLLVGIAGAAIHLPPALSFFVSPKGALATAALVALLVARSARGDALESAVSRTAPLLLMIGAASALGTMIVQTLPILAWASAVAHSGFALPALFAFTALFKTAKGSSMATFAGTTGIVAAILPSLGVSPAAATLAMCCGAFVTIAANDSLYWIVREDFEGSSARLGNKLWLGAILQGFAALVVTEVMVRTGLI